MENKFKLMNIALEIFKLEIQKGNVLADFNNIYTTLKFEMLGENVVKQLQEKIKNYNSKPTAEEYFNNKDLGVDSKTPDMREMEGEDVESFNMRVK